MRIKCLNILLSALILSSCVSTGTGHRSYDLINIDAETVSEKLKKDRNELRSLSGRFDFSYSTESERKQSSAYIFITAQDTLYLEIKGIVGETEAVLFIDKDSLKAENYMDNIKIRDKFSEGSLNRITGINMSVSDLRNTILGYDAVSANISIKENEDSKLKVRAVHDSLRYDILILDSELNITGISEFREREMVSQRQYDYFTNEKGVMFPRRIRMNRYNPPEKLTIFFTSVKINSYPEISE
ncbi:MAG TPA: lipoprotein insertase outer membrane protein LolB [Clostridiales bacterium]|nr:lipoprotein insertase outer membrane protein LolB [Clostridiales bacterium]